MTCADGPFRDRYIDWLVRAGTAQRTIPGLLNAFCNLLTEEGLAIFRCNLATDTVHPQMTGLRHVWFAEETDPGAINPAVLVARRQYQMGSALIDEVFFNATGQKSPQYKDSPFHQVEMGGELYSPIAPKGAKQRFPLFDDLAANGCTAYFGMTLKSFAGMNQMMGLASRRPGGLEDRLDDLRWAISLLTLHLNTLIEFSIKDTLARTYLGGDPGQRVSQGMIAVGNVISLEGAIWFSDLRGFTQASETLSPEELILTLNEYFDVVVPPIHAHRGEVLKYIGDAILAVFPVSSFEDRTCACRAALEAVEEGERRLAERNLSRRSRGLAPLKHGIGLNYGEAQYGNIGSSDRLDFTLIGREVNIASRIEGLTKSLDESLLCSETFAEAAPGSLERIGDFDLKGVADPVGIFRPLLTPGPDSGVPVSEVVPAR